MKYKKLLLLVSALALMCGNVFCQISGCMDPTAVNYNQAATEDDGSCEYPAIEAVADTTNFPAEGGSTTVMITSNVYWQTDITPATPAQEISINPPSGNATQGQGISGTITVQPNTSEEARQFTIAFRNGNNALARLIINQAGYVAPVWGCMDPEAANYDSLATETSANYPCIFYGCMDEGALNYDPKATEQPASYDPCEYPVYGCMDPEAANYDSLATETSANYPCIFYGCMDEGALNYDPKATEQPATHNPCKYHVPGCMDQYALNYDSLATIQTANSPCEYRHIEEPITGCTERNALNYNPAATVSDYNSCIFQVIDQPVYGCIDQKALNFNPNATELDNSCVYAYEGNTFFAEPEPDEVIQDTVGTQPLENCDLNIDLLISLAYIAGIEINGNQITAEWIIEQMNGESFTYFVDYIVNSSGLNLFYLSLICNNGVLRSSDSDVTGFTVSAIYDIGDFTGISQPISQTSNLTVYPNPFSDLLTILVKGAKADIALYSVDGKPLAIYSNLNEANIATSKLPAGVYVVKVTTADGKTETVTVVKK